jgi:predicted dehydrogenase
MNDIKDKLGIALVGLGKYSEGQLAPALQETSHCRLTGLVSGDPQKRRNGKRNMIFPTEIYTTTRISIPSGTTRILILFMSCCRIP